MYKSPFEELCKCLKFQRDAQCWAHKYVPLHMTLHLEGPVFPSQVILTGFSALIISCKQIYFSDTAKYCLI